MAPKVEPTLESIKEKLYLTPPENTKDKLYPNLMTKLNDNCVICGNTGETPAGKPCSCQWAIRPTSEVIQCKQEPCPEMEVKEPQKDIYRQRGWEHAGHDADNHEGEPCSELEASKREEKTVYASQIYQESLCLKECPELPNINTGAPAVEVVFFNGSGGKVMEKTYIFTQRPMGVNFWGFEIFGPLPMKVRSFTSDSYARKLGVQKNWVIKSIAGTDVTGMKFKEAQAVLRSHMSTLPTQDECDQMQTFN